MLEAEGAQLPAALTLPGGQEVKWSIVLVPGSLANDVDGNLRSEDTQCCVMPKLERIPAR